MRPIATDDRVLSQVASELAGVPLFRPLPEEQRREIAERATLVEADIGEVIVREGERTDDFFVLLSGEAAVSVQLEEQGESIEVGVVLPHDILGELAVLLEEPRSATVVAQQRCRLLRLDAATFRDLAEEMPGFGLTLSRELARRFRAALDERNEIQSQHMPAPVAVRRAEISHMPSYLARYYASAVQGVLRRHQLLSSGQFPRYRDSFSFSAQEQARWFDFFGVSPAERRTPFTYFTTSATMALMQMLSDVGVNFRYLMHLKSEMNFNPEGRVLEPGQSYDCAYQIADIIPLRNDRAALVCRTEIRDAEGRLMLITKDFFIIKNLEREYVAALKKSKRLGKHDAAQFRTLSRRKATLLSAEGNGNGSAEVRTREIFVPEDAGVAYGRISGDMNMVHTTRMAAKIFGYDRPFIQGLCTANFVLQTLTGAAGRPPQRFTISFSRQVFVGQPVRIHHTDRVFEVCNQGGELVAFGKWSGAAPPE